MRWWWEKGELREKDLHETLRLKFDVEPKSHENEYLGFAKGKLYGMTKNTNKTIMLADGTRIFIKANEENPKIFITKPGVGIGKRFWKKSEYKLIENMLLPVFEIYQPPFCDPVTWIAIQPPVGYILNEDKLETGTGEFLLEEDLPKRDDGRFFYGSLAGDTPINKEVPAMEPEIIRTGFKVEELEEFETHEETSGTYNEISKTIANDNPDYWIQWDSTNYILSFPGDEELIIPPFESIPDFRWYTAVTFWPVLKSPRIYKWPLNSKDPEAVYLYNIVYLSRWCGGGDSSNVIAKDMVLVDGLPRKVGTPASGNPYQPFADGTPPPTGLINGIYGMVFEGKNYIFQTEQIYIFKESIYEDTILDTWYEGPGIENPRTDGPFQWYTDYYYVVSEFSQMGQGKFPADGYGIFQTRAAKKDWDEYKVKTKEIL